MINEPSHFCAINGCILLSILLLQINSWLMFFELNSACSINVVGNGCGSCCHKKSFNFWWNYISLISLGAIILFDILFCCSNHAILLTFFVISFFLFRINTCMNHNFWRHLLCLDWPVYSHYFLMKTIINRDKNKSRSFILFDWIFLKCVWQ